MKSTLTQVIPGQQQQQSVEVSQTISQQVQHTLNSWFQNQQVSSSGRLTENSDFQVQDHSAEQLQNLSLATANNISDQLGEDSLFEGGVLISLNQDDELAFAIARRLPGFAISSELLLSQTEMLDLSGIMVGARITSAGDISFYRGRSGARFESIFQQLLQTEALQDNRLQAKILNSTLDAFCKEENSSEKSRLLKNAEEYCRDRLEQELPIETKDLARALDQQNPSRFLDFAHSQDISLQPEIPSSKTQLRQLSQISGRGDGISLTFKQELLGDRVIYDVASDTLTIKGLPKGLKKQLS